MAELLIARQDIGPFVRGELVAVADDGHPWTVNESLPDYYQMQVAGPSAAQARRYVQRLRRAAIPDVDPEADAPDPPDRYVEVRPVNINVPLDSLPNNVQNKLENDGRIEVDLQTARQYVRRRKWDQQQLEVVDDGPFDGA